MDLERNFIALADHKGDLLTRFDFKPTIQRFIESTEETGSSATILLHHDDSRVRVKSYLTHFPAMTIDGINKTVSACPCNVRKSDRIYSSLVPFIYPIIYHGIGEDRVLLKHYCVFTSEKKRCWRSSKVYDIYIYIYMQVLCLEAQWSHCDDRIDGFNSR